jgi:hypothetical protein
MPAPSDSSTTPPEPTASLFLELTMKMTIALLSLATACSAVAAIAQDNTFAKGPIKRVLLISVDGMHAVDLQNCVNGIATVNGGDPYCPALAALTRSGINYVSATTPKPSDSFPGLITLVTGGSPALTGVYYDVAYARNLDAPATTTGNGLAAGPCTPGTAPTGTTTSMKKASTSTKPNSTVERREQP